MSPRSSLALAAACLVAFIASKANAQCPSAPDAGYIRACAVKSTGAMRCVGPTDLCKSSETLLQWNIQSTSGGTAVSGSVRGQLALCSGDVGGLQVFVPGYSFQAITNSAGQFQLSFVPPGTYSLSFARAGTVLKTIPVVQVIAAQVTDLGTLQLTDLTTNQNCGACSNVCQPGTACERGSCVVTCPTGYSVCDGSCAYTQSDPNNCGTCGTVCTASGANTVGTCSNATCGSRCAVNYGDCDGNPVNGCEANLGSAVNCGRCGNTCAAVANGRYACGSVCTSVYGGPWNYTCLAWGPGCVVDQVSCNPGWANCNGVISDGCETSLKTNSNCGACGRTCSGTCNDGVCIGGAF